MIRIRIFTFSLMRVFVKVKSQIVISLRRRIKESLFLDYDDRG